MPLTAADASAVSFTIVTAPAHGTLTGHGPTWTYTPAADYNGNDAMTVTAEDIRGSATATVTIHVTAVDDAPVANPDSVAAGFVTPLTLFPAMLLTNDTDVDSTTLTVTGVTAGTHGTVVMTDGDIIFTPEIGYTGIATFTYAVSDGTLTSHGTVTVTIGPDGPPVGVADSGMTDEDVPLAIADTALLVNDTDPENQTLAISAVGNAVHGTVSHSGTQVTFTPDANYHGLASFDYTVTDGYMTAVASVTITVNSVNDAPVATDDAATTFEDNAATILAADLLINDTDVDGDSLVVTAVTSTVNTHGTVTLSSGIITYTPDPNFNGTADFTYTVSDGQGGTATGTVTVTVTAVDDAPVAVNDTRTVLEDSGANAINVLANDTDVDGGPISIGSITQPAHGAAVITGGGTGVTYAPAPNYCNHVLPGAPSPGPKASLFDQFTYTLSPGGSTATVTVTVTCVDDPPVAVNDLATVSEDSTNNLLNVLANDIDIDGGTDTVASVTQPANGTAAVGPNGLSVSYTPVADYCNQFPNAPRDTFSYTLAPGGSSATVSVAVNCACGKNKSTDFFVGSSN